MPKQGAKTDFYELLGVSKVCAARAHAGKLGGGAMRGRRGARARGEPPPKQGAADIRPRRRSPERSRYLRGAVGGAVQRLVLALTLTRARPAAHVFARRVPRRMTSRKATGRWRSSITLTREETKRPLRL